MTTSRFDDLRPYNDSEIPAALQRIAADPYFPAAMQYIFEGEELKNKLEAFTTYTTVEAFQSQIMDPAIKSIVRKTMDNFTCHGLEQLDPARPYLFVSNHRDILLDSALLQIALHDQGFRTTEITFGNNLMQKPLVVDIGKCNKMFKVIRGGNPRDFYRNSLHLSEYIRHTLLEKKESVWIAQRNGRTKDGNDQTNQALIKMFALSGGKDLVENIAELQIVPLSISYQYETCDKMKVRESYLSRNQTYIKENNEDLLSIITGITQPKGNVHLEVCAPITQSDLEILRGLDRNEATLAIAHIIDKRIYDHYKLWNTNFIAYDMLYHTFEFTDQYSPSTYRHFAARMHEQLRNWPDEKLELMNIFLKLYSNPVLNCLPADRRLSYRPAGQA